MTEDRKYKFNPPPNWPKPPNNWTPPKGWKPDSSWPAAPEGWLLWIPDGEPEFENTAVETPMPQDDVVVASQESSVNYQNQTTDIHGELERLRVENESLKQRRLDDFNDAGELVELNDEKVLQEVGIYRYHHPLENAEAFKERLKSIDVRKIELVKTDHAIEKSNMFTFDNSLAKGRRMTADLSKLMLRAYNAEADNCIRSLRAGNILTAKKRMERTCGAIAKLGKMMEMHISDSYHLLQIEELELTSDYLMKKQEEKELAREERARLREQAKVEKELAAEKEKLLKERTHILNTLESLQNSGGGDESLELKLTAIDEAIAQNDYRIANIRAGYVYVVSNRGAFGDNVVKIGLTRRLEPVDRVTELSGAAVPFKFDIHTLFFSEDAVSLENELHHHFSERRVNFANARKEFFFASPREVLDVLQLKVGNLLEFTENPESTEFLQSLKYWPVEKQVSNHGHN